MVPLLGRTLALAWRAWRSPQTPLLVKLLLPGALLYALLPLDLFPDIIPLLGFVDDLLVGLLALLLLVGLGARQGPSPRGGGRPQVIEVEAIPVEDEERPPG